MAEFKTHLSAGAMTGAVAVTTLWAANLASPGEGALFMAAAAIGGILPDIDADNATPLHAAFTVFALLGAFTLLFLCRGRYSVAELLVVWLASYLVIRVGLFQLFIRLTTHRGIIHSIPAGVAFGLLTVIGIHSGLGMPTTVAWLGGIFLLAGFLIHLLLDEWASLNLFGMRGVRNSLGSALKWTGPDWRLTVLAYLLVAALGWMAPDPQPLWRMVGEPTAWRTVRARFFPQSGWFQTHSNATGKP
jgi:hypothetical protein